MDLSARAVKSVVLKTERLVLRPIGLSDLLTAHKYASDVSLTKYMIFLPDRTVEDTARFLSYAENEWKKANPETYEFAVMYDNSHIGGVGLSVIDQTTGELGWIFLAEYHGKGLCTEAARALTDFAKKIGMKKLIAQCDTRNVPSRRVMERIGMKLECERARTYKDERGVAKEYTYSMEI